MRTAVARADGTTPSAYSSALATAVRRERSGRMRHGRQAHLTTIRPSSSTNATSNMTSICKLKRLSGHRWLESAANLKLRAHQDVRK